SVLRHGVSLWAFHRPVDDDLVDQTVLDRLLAGHEHVAIGVLLDLLDALPRVLDEHVVQLLADTQDLARLDVDVGRLTLNTAERLMDHDAGVRKREPLSLPARSEQPRRHARRLPE